jgi:peptide methionine sulfoxide reductase MsrB
MTAKLGCDHNYFGFDAADNLCMLIQNFKSLVIHYRSAKQAAQKLAEKLKISRKEFEVLVQDTPTRWWYTYDMLDSINQCKTCLAMLEMQEEVFLSKDNYLTESGWTTIPSLLKRLKPFKQDQLKLEGDQQVTTSRVPLAVIRLMKMLTHCALKRKVLPAKVKGVAQNMLNNFERRRQFTTGLTFNDVLKG